MTQDGQVRKLRALFGKMNDGVIFRCPLGAEMSTTREEVLKSAMELSEADRLQIATELIDSVAEEWPGWSIDDPDLVAELERRARDGSRGVSWATVQAQLRAEPAPSRAREV